MSYREKEMEYYEAIMRSQEPFTMPTSSLRCGFSAWISRLATMWISTVAISSSRGSSLAHHIRCLQVEHRSHYSRSLTEQQSSERRAGNRIVFLAAAALETGDTAVLLHPRLASRAFRDSKQTAPEKGCQATGAASRWPRSSPRAVGYLSGETGPAAMTLRAPGALVV